MSGEEAKALAHRFQVIESCVGLLGCLLVTFAVWAPYWLDSQGLWTVVNTNSSNNEWVILDSDQTGESVFKGESDMTFMLQE